MLSLIMKRDLTEEKRKEIESCLIKFEKPFVEFDDGFKFEIGKTTGTIEGTDQPYITVNVTVYVNGTCVTSMVYDFMYYMNVITVLIRNAFDLQVKCSCGDPNCGCQEPTDTTPDMVSAYFKQKGENTKSETNQPKNVKNS